ncbi:MAG TPA: di-trans,poly-cis-decaprenylcistransferase [Gemmatimonadaceae bacterium]|nr:di-trans,poly-cis-decaprenylcistransferase [Gemmatimonadaceae bacterium]
MQSTRQDIAQGLHVAIVMDGNGRWATARGLPRRRGHEAGARTVRTIVEAAPALGIDLLTLYAFSADNWKRPRREVGGLLALFRRYLDSECARLREAGVRLSIIGRRDRLPRSLCAAIERAETETGDGRAMHLRVAIDYSGRDAIVAAAARASLAGSELTRERFAALIAAAQHGGDARDVDLLVRTGGERRLSDFMLWEAAYAELWFTPRAWPDFSAAMLGAAVEEFRGRDRRFGGLPGVAAAG